MVDQGTGHGDLYTQIRGRGRREKGMGGNTGGCVCVYKTGEDRGAEATFGPQLEDHTLRAPRSLWARPLVDSQEGRDIARQTSRRFLMTRITQKARTIRELEHDLFFQRRQLEFNLRPQHASALEAA